MRAEKINSQSAAPSGERALFATSGCSLAVPGAAGPRRAGCFWALLCFLAFAGPSYGTFKIEPAIITFRADMLETTAWLEIVHTGGGPIAVTLEAYNRELSLDGEVKTDSLAPCGDFLVYPSEILLYPGDREKIQVNYRGPRRVAADKAYQLVSRQVELPSIGEEGGFQAGVSMLMNYYTVIAFETGKPGKLEFVSSRPIGGGQIEVIVENKGAGRAPVNNIAIVAGGTKITDFTGKKNSVMPGQRRRFTFRHGRPLSAKEFSIAVLDRQGAGR